MPAEWLTATLDTTTAPATLTLEVDHAGLPNGTYTATVPISSTASGVTNSPQNVVVTLVLATPGWLTASLNQLVAPAVLTLSVDTAGLAAGTYNATVPIVSTASGVTNSPQSVTVTLEVVDGPAPTYPVIFQASTVVRDGAAAPLPGRPISWRSSDESIATVNAAGVVTRLQAGAVTIHADVRSGFGVVSRGDPLPES